jgi:hypothetical protein
MLLAATAAAGFAQKATERTVAAYKYWQYLVPFFHPTEYFAQLNGTLSQMMQHCLIINAGRKSKITDIRCSTHFEVKLKK